MEMDGGREILYELATSTYLAARSLATVVNDILKNPIKKGAEFINTHT